MKKILTLLLILFMVCGCSNSVDSWQKVAKEYEELKQSVIAITENSETFLKADYLNAISEIKELVNSIEISTDDDNKEKLEKIYKLTYYIETVSSKFSGPTAEKINATAKFVDALIQSVYDNDAQGFKDAKQEVLDILTELEALPGDQWAKVEKKTLLTWQEVETDYETIESNAKQEANENKEVSETEIEELKDYIIANYEEIKYGVTLFNKDIASQIYTNAVKLLVYTKKSTSDEGLMVKQFAKDTIAYVKQCYGKTLSDDEKLSQDYDLSIEEANKWTQSVWNIIVTELKA